MWWQRSMEIGRFDAGFRQKGLFVLCRVLRSRNPPVPYTLQKSLRHLTTAMKANSRSHSHWKCSNIVNTSRQARFDTCTTCMLSRRILDARVGFDGCHGSVEFTIASEYQAISLHRGYTSERWLFHILPIENDGGNMSPPLRK